MVQFIVFFIPVLITVFFFSFTCMTVASSNAIVMCVSSTFRSEAYLCITVFLLVCNETRLEFMYFNFASHSLRGEKKKDKNSLEFCKCQCENCIVTVKWIILKMWILNNDLQTGACYGFCLPLGGTYSFIAIDCCLWCYHNFKSENWT